VTSTAQKIARLRGKQPLVVSIVAPSDVAGGRAGPLWGDYWVKWELERAFRSLGVVVQRTPPDEKAPDILIHLSGGTIKYLYGRSLKHRRVPEAAYKIVWVYSHPESIADKTNDLRLYDKIFCCSTFFTENLRQQGYDAQVMLGATAKRPAKVPIVHDIVFVGNAHGPAGKHGSAVINALGTVPYKVSVYGSGWTGKLPEGWHKGQYFPYPELANLYASAVVCLQDHRPEMARGGFVSVKLFDILASGGFAISDCNIGIKGVFKGAVPEYTSPAHLRELLEHYIRNPDARKPLMQLGRRTAFACPWTKRAKLFLRGLQSA